jgi:hypothetical protein
MDAYVVKLYDKCTKKWLTLTKHLSLEQAQSFYNRVTKQETVHCNPKHGDYYKIFNLSAGNLIIKQRRK